jgi:hypothetical protein
VVFLILSGRFTGLPNIVSSELKKIDAVGLLYYVHALVDFDALITNYGNANVSKKVLDIKNVRTSFECNHYQPTIKMTKLRHHDKPPVRHDPMMTFALFSNE